MSLEISHSASVPGQLRVCGALTIYDAPAAKGALLQALANGSELEIDLSGVDELDTAGVQVLVLVKREGARAGKPVRFTQHSAATLEVLDRYNLASGFGDPVVISPDC